MCTIIFAILSENKLYDPLYSKREKPISDQPEA
jgi:hypothetical protein